MHYNILYNLVVPTSTLLFSFPTIQALKTLPRIQNSIHFTPSHQPSHQLYNTFNSRTITAKAMSNLDKNTQTIENDPPHRRSARLLNLSKSLNDDYDNTKAMKHEKVRNTMKSTKRKHFMNGTNNDATLENIRITTIDDKDLNQDSTTKNKEGNHTNESQSTQQHELLLDIGPLIKGELIKRPSSKIKSPYVADVKLLRDGCHDDSNDEQDGEVGENDVIQAHSPSLDVGGLCVPGSTVFMTKRNPGGKTSHALELLLAPGPNSNSVGGGNGNKKGDGNGELNGTDDVLVGCHPSLGEKLSEEVLKKGLLRSCLGFGPAIPIEELKSSSKKKKQKKNSKKIVEEKSDITNAHEINNIPSTKCTTILYKQRTYGDSRIDFELVDNSNINSSDDDKKSTQKHPRRALIEVKNVVCSDYCAEYAPVKTGPNHCVIIASNNDTDYRVEKDATTAGKNSTDYKRSGIFPWGRVNQQFEGEKVVSERAIKHLRNLSSLQSDLNDENVQTVVLFVINRSDCEQMRACHEACPVFASELKAASDRGTLVISVRVRWTEDGKAYFDGIVPVSL